MVDPATGNVELRLHIDLLRSFDTPDAYRRFARSLPRQRDLVLYERLADGIELRQGNRRLPLEVRSARPPVPFDAEAFEDPFSWPRVWIDLAGGGYDPDAPLQIRFTTRFVFEEPVALTLMRDAQRISRWLISDQPGPILPALQSTGSDPTIVMGTQADPGPPLHQTLWIGFRHILPGGVDHLMFLLSLLLLCRSLRTLVWLVSAFTVGHCLTLAIAALRLVTVSTGVVEPLILLSISLYALLALRDIDAARAHHLLPVTAIGLLHGLGFATAYETAFEGAGWAQRPVSHLLSFNLGIELAQLLFVAAIYPIMLRYRSLVHRPLALLLVCFPALWAFFSVQAQSDHQALQGRAHPQKHAIGAFQQPQDRRPASEEPERSQQRNCAPHDRKGRGTRDQFTIRIPGVQPGKQALPVERASTIAMDVDEIDGRSSIQTPHQCDLANAQRALSVVPDSHAVRHVSSCCHDHESLAEPAREHISGLF